MRDGPASALQAVIRVGDGRGFIVEGRRGRYIITAAHCLPHLPPAHLASYPEERSFAELLAPLGAEPSIWAECLFADPVGDIALLGAPDDQELPDECEAYEALVDSADALAVAAAPQRGSGWMLLLDGMWHGCVFSFIRRNLWLERGGDAIKSGMSGSPIVMDDGRAVGIVSTSGGGGAQCPRLAGSLPGWALEELIGA